MFEIFDCFPSYISLLASFILACVFIVKAIIMNFSEDWDVGTLYLSTKFDRFPNNGDLGSLRNPTHLDFANPILATKGLGVGLVLTPT